MASEAGADEVQQALDLLQEDGMAVEWNRRWLAVRFTDWVAGVVQQLSGGDAFIRSGHRGEAGYFVSARNLKGALAGDTVLVRPLKRKRKQPDQRLPEVTVVRVLKHRHRTLVGTLEMDGERRWLVPFDPKLDLELEVIGGDELLEDSYVVVAIERPARGDRSPAQGRIVEVLGSPDVPGVDVEIVLRHYEIPDEFPESVLAEAAGRPADPDTADFEGREDLRDQTLVTIDGETARDFDDAISVDALEDGSFQLGVHIADVSHYVRPGSALDLEAYRRGTSVYFPDRAVPMLPETLSNGLCSLRPEVPRLTLSAFMHISADGEVVERRFAQTVIRSARRLTYTEVRRLLEEPKNDDANEYGEVLTLLQKASPRLDADSLPAAPGPGLDRLRPARGGCDPRQRGLYRRCAPR
jgi:ribonuclease R